MVGKMMKKHTVSYKTTKKCRKLTDFINHYHNQRSRILELLQKNKFVPTAQLRLIAYQYNSRLHELRKQNHNIISTKDEEGRWGFKLIEV